MNTTEAAALIRRALKTKLGATARQVSVRCDIYSMGSSIDVKIKDPSISKAAVEAIALEHQRVSRDSSGEILSGGNMFIEVEYEGAAVAPLRGEVLAALGRLAVAEIATFRGVQVMRADAQTFTVVGELFAHIGRCHGAEICARQIAEALLSAQVAA